MSLMERSGFLTRVLLIVATNFSFSPGLKLRLCREEGGVGEAGDRFFFLLEGGRVAEPSVLESEDGFSVLLLLSGGVVVAAGSMDCRTLRLVAARRVVAIREIVTHSDCMEWVHGKLE